MSNKARTPMTKPEEVIAWAEETKAGNGEAFTMLKKEEQLLIAKFILAMRDHIKKLQSGAAQDEGKPSTAEADKKTTEVSEPVEDKPVEVKPQVVDRQLVVEDRRQSNMDYFKANNVDMNRAFQLYCVWRNCDPQTRTIFDDERKAWVKAASFAYWLNLPHE